MNSNPAAPAADTYNPSSKPPAVSTAPKPPAVLPKKLEATYKQLTWVLKVEGDAFKIPDIKSISGINVAGSFDAPFPVAPRKDKSSAAEQTPIPVSSGLPVPSLKIIAMIIRLDATTPKTIKALRISRVTQDKDTATDGVQTNPDVLYRELGMDATNSTLVYFIAAPDVESQPANDLYAVNDNAFEVKLAISVAYGPP